MKNRSRLYLLTLFLLSALGCAALSGCAGGPLFPDPTPTPLAFSQAEVPSDETEVTMVLQSGEVSLLDSLPGLVSADLSGSPCYEEIFLWAQAHPQVAVRYTVPLPTGETVGQDVTELDLSALSGDAVEETAKCLACLPQLKLVLLGQERAGLEWEDIRLLREACPQADFDFSFELYGLDLRLEDTRLDLNHIPIDDGGALVRRVLPCMPSLRTLDMDSCGVSDEDMAAIRDQFPQVKVIWRVWFGDAYSVRTDVERILASQPTKGGMLTAANSGSLKYCTEVKYLDIGHNETLDDISFVGYMPKLEVAVLAMALWSDASPLANCPELEYLELQCTNLEDLSPLSGLTKLRHLNICMCRSVTDISPLYALTGLERFWIGGLDPVPVEQVEQMRAAAPNCVVNNTAYDPTEGAWRYSGMNEWTYIFIPCERYEKLREQFGYYADNIYSFSWNDPLY